MTSSRIRYSQPCAPRCAGQQAGFTLVELMVAIVLILLIVLVATGVLLASKSSFATNDSVSQLQDQSRFGTYVLRRLSEQAGYEDYTNPNGSNRASDAVTDAAALIAAATPCYSVDVCGINNRRVNANQVINGAAGRTGTFTDGQGNSITTDTLVIRFQGRSLPTDVTQPDGSMIDCAGNGQAAPMPNSSAVSSRAISVFYVDYSATTGEPELMCSYIGTTGAVGSISLVRGIDTFQVLYGLDTNDDSVPEAYVRADQIPAAAAAAGVTQQTMWRRVRAVRFGMILRGPVGSGPASDGNTRVLYPLGAQAAGEPSGTFAVPNDRRLRRVVTFTVMLRNNL